MRNLSPKGRKNKSSLEGLTGTEKHAIEHDDFDIENFQTIKSHSKSLIEDEKNLSKDYSQFPELQQDVFSSLYRYAPRMNEDHQMKLDYLINKEIMKQLMDSQKYKELRVMTQLDILNSTVGTEAIADEMKSLIEKMKEQQKALAAAEDAADKLGNAQGSGGEARDEEEEDDPNKPKKKYKGSKKYTVEEAQIEYQKALQNFKQSMQKPEIKSAIQNMATKVRDQVKETSNMIQNWGLGSSDAFSRKPIQEKMRLLQRLGSDKMRQIALLGRKYKSIVAQMQHERIRHGSESIYSVEIGQVLERALPSELMRLNDPTTEMGFMKDWSEGKILQYALESKKKKIKGPIIVTVNSLRPIKEIL